MGRRPWWRLTESRGWALVGAITASGLAVLLGVAGVLGLIDQPRWRGLAVFFGLANFYLAGAYWTNWSRLRLAPERQSKGETG